MQQNVRESGELAMAALVFREPGIEAGFELPSALEHLRTSKPSFNCVSLELKKDTFAPVLASRQPGSLTA